MKRPDIEELKTKVGPDGEDRDELIAWIEHLERAIKNHCDGPPDQGERDLRLWREAGLISARQCCTRDSNQDGDCDRHSAPGEPRRPGGDR